MNESSLGVEVNRRAFSRNGVVLPPDGGPGAAEVGTCYAGMILFRSRLPRQGRSSKTLVFARGSEVVFDLTPRGVAIFDRMRRKVYCYTICVTVLFPQRNCEPATV